MLVREELETEFPILNDAISLDFQKTRLEEVKVWEKKERWRQTKEAWRSFTLIFVLLILLLTIDFYLTNLGEEGEAGRD